jgi:Zn-dependent protease with chaperone function
MIVPYLARLLCLALATFFLIHLLLGLAVAVLSPAAVRLTDGMRPRLAAGLLLSLRLFPLGFTVLVVAGLCVPSYLWFEPEAAPEYVGWGCLAAALLGLGVWAISVVRGLRATVRSRRYIRQCQRAGRMEHFPGEHAPVLVIDSSGPLLALAGIWHPRLVISREVLGALSAGQLSAALRHERAHRISRDNLKRLLMLLSPDILPGWRGMAALEHGWARLTEWAADDRAVAEDSRSSFALAEALVQVARMGSAPVPAPLMTSLLADSQDLAARVERLLGPASVAEEPEPWRGAIVCAGFTMASVVLAILLQPAPATLSTAHRLLEHLVR